ncbi:MAG TPA: hypothetical protein DCL86_17000 [Bacteroidales bacterium]|jgi:hypothetical protein|nr:hypothetical protein [Bacteroidales bacterium]
MLMYYIAPACMREDCNLLSNIYTSIKGCDFFSRPKKLPFVAQVIAQSPCNLKILSNFTL